MMDRFQMRRSEQIALGTALPAVVLGLGIGPWVALWSQLPDPVATHFGASGRANGSAPLAAQILLHAVIAVGCAAVIARAVRRPLELDSGGVAGGAAFVGTLFGVLGVMLALANRHHGDWHDVTLSAGAVGGAIGAAVGLALPVVVITQLRLASAPRSMPSMDVGVDERVAWFGTSKSTGFAMAGAAFVAIGAVSLAVLGLWSVGFTLLPVGLVLVAFSSLDASVSREGVRVSSGPIHWPVVRIPLQQVESAYVIDFRPTRWGGWGYRGSVRLFGRAAWGLRAGPAVELHLAGGRRFVFTVDHADDGAAVLNGLLAHHPLR
jgi:hypothetical protein